MFSPLLFVTLIAVLSAAAGVSLTSIHGIARRMVPFSGGVLIGVALIWMLPEMAEFFGWPVSIAWTAVGCLLLLSIDRFVHPVCSTELRGFAAPLLIAAALHSAIDGWSVAATYATPSFGRALVIGLALHKIPEGIALGAIMRASLASRWMALGACALAQSATLVGGGVESLFATQLSERNLHVLLAIAAGSFLYLGGHAVHSEARRSGTGPAVWPAITGVAGSGVLRFFVSG